MLPVPIRWLVRRRLGRLLVLLFTCAVSAGTAVAASAAGAVSARPAVAVTARAARTGARLTGPQTAGRVTFVGASSFTIQTGGRRTGMLNALARAADAVTAKDYPYVWGGGHGAAGVASVGDPGPGHNGTRIGYDCSGAVAAVLARVGLWRAGSGVPNDAGVISALLRRGVIAPGPASAPDGVTLYDHPGVHIFMNINGRFWGTSDGGAGADRRGGAGWISDGAWDAHSKQFKQYHFVPSVLKNSAGYGQDYTFQFVRNPFLMLGLLPGETVRVSYAHSGIGTMNAMAIDYTGARLDTGTVVAVALDDSSFTLMGANGTLSTYETGGNPALTGRLALGDVVSVAYTTAHAASAFDGAFVASASRTRPVTMAHTVQLKAAAGAAEVSGTVTGILGAGAAIRVQSDTGTGQTFTTAGDRAMLRGIRRGETVTVSFVQATGGMAVAERVQTAAPSPPSTVPSTTTPPVTATGTPKGARPTGSSPVGQPPKG